MGNRPLAVISLVFSIGGVVLFVLGALRGASGVIGLGVISVIIGFFLARAARPQAKA